MLIYRGVLIQDTSLSPDGTWVKEVELADFDNDGWLDILMLQKQPLVDTGTEFQIRPLPNRDVLYLSRGAVLQGLNFELDALQPDAFTLKGDAFPVSYSTTRGYDAEVGDLDGDGRLDVVRPDVPGLLVVLWGDGTGRFPAVTDVMAEVGGDPNSSCVVDFIEGAPNNGGNYDDADLADFDGDGDLDFVAANWLANTCGESGLDFGINPVLENLAADGAPRSFNHVPVPSFVARGTHSVAAGDANRDGNVDVLLAHGSGAGQPELYLGTSTNFTFPSSPSFTFTDFGFSNPTVLADIVGDTVGDGIPDDLPDLTGDGHPDAFLSKANGTDSGGLFGLYINTGMTGAPYDEITTCSTCSTANKYDTRYADLDLDGFMEAIMPGFNFSESRETGNTTLQQTQLHVFRFTSGGFSDVTLSYVDPDYAGKNQGGVAVAVGDLDNDGDLDVVLGGVFGTVPPPGTEDVDVFGASHVYENRTVTLLQNRTISAGSATFLALKTLTGGPGVVIDGSAQVTFEAGQEIRLTDGFRATPGTGGQFVARILP